MAQVELKNMYINIGANNGSEKLRKTRLRFSESQLKQHMHRTFIFIFLV
jgi:hypothetical protein